MDGMAVFSMQEDVCHVHGCRKKGQLVMTGLEKGLEKEHACKCDEIYQAII